MSRETYIIAEAGVNHNGSLEKAKKLVEIAKSAGADAVKFQTFNAELLVTSYAVKSEYQRQNDGEGSQYDMLKKLMLSDDEWYALKDFCLEKELEFLSTPFDLESIKFLRKLGVGIWKVPSGEITNLPYLREIGSYGEEVILSTGMSEMVEIIAALDVLERAGTPRGEITVLHCNTEYPTPICDVNLSAMFALRDAFPGLKGVGFSDHTLGIEVAVAAVAMGATVIEKHFTLDRSLPGPDHKASLESGELTAMVKAIRNVEKAIGDGFKQPSESEKKNIFVARKSIVAAVDINKGEPFTEQNLTVKRPGCGLSPMLWDQVVGRVAQKNYFKDELIEA